MPTDTDRDDPFEGAIAAEATGDRLAAVSSGLDHVRAIVSGEIPQASMAVTLGFELISADFGESRFEGVPGEQHLNPMKTVHGGLALTMLDSAAGCAVHTTLAEGEVYATLETKVNMLRPILPDGGTVVATGKVLHRGSRTALSEATLRSAETGKVLAHATSTCLIMDERAG
jgi:uncharacterized protein (TIGR00369 family)